MYKVATITSILLLLSTTCIADPTRPPNSLVAPTQNAQIKTHKPKVEATINKGETWYAIIDGKLVSSAFNSEQLRIYAITANNVDLAYWRNGQWVRETIVVTPTFKKIKSSARIE